MSRSKQQSSCKQQHFIEVNPQDVIVGRGGRSNHHEGNKTFRAMVDSRLLEYDTADKFVKKQITEQVVRAIKAMSPPGRFVEQDKDTKLWVEVDDKKAQHKTSQAFRDRRAAATRRGALISKDENVDTPSDDEVQPESQQVQPECPLAVDPPTVSFAVDPVTNHLTNQGNDPVNHLTNHLTNQGNESNSTVDFAEYAEYDAPVEGHSIKIEAPQTAPKRARRDESFPRFLDSFAFLTQDDEDMLESILAEELGTTNQMISSKAATSSESLLEIIQGNPVSDDESSSQIRTRNNSLVSSASASSESDELPTSLDVPSRRKSRRIEWQQRTSEQRSFSRIMDDDDDGECCHPGMFFTTRDRADGGSRCEDVFAIDKEEGIKSPLQPRTRWDALSNSIMMMSIETIVDDSIDI